MKVVFRADASIEIGTGHVMRCLTLARVLAEQGAICQFICRAHEGNLIEYVNSQGFHVEILRLEKKTKAHADDLAHSNWLGADITQDAKDCSTFLEAFQPDWLIVDHYALDARWEMLLAPLYRKLMVIDDLANRPHICSLLLDQTFGRNKDDYATHVSVDCIFLCGSNYSLIRPEFANLRDYSLKRREKPVLKKLLINLGGVDKNNVTCLVLKAIRTFNIAINYNITVVMGRHAPWIKSVLTVAKRMPCVTEVLVGVENIAEIMAESDLAIGAAGSSTWERCCLGLPTIAVITAENQEMISLKLNIYGAVLAISILEKDFSSQLNSAFIRLSDPVILQQISSISATVTDGFGARRIGAVINAR